MDDFCFFLKTIIYTLYKKSREKRFLWNQKCVLLTCTITDIKTTDENDTKDVLLLLQIEGRL